MDLRASFDLVDDILAEADEGRLLTHGRIVVGRSGRVGPLLELVRGRERFPRLYTDVSSESSFWAALQRSKLTNPVGMERDAPFGIWRFDGIYHDDESKWELWALRAETAANRAGLPGEKIVAAVIELRENILLHSRLSKSGIVAFAATGDTFEAVISDSGVGVLESLRENPQYKSLSDHGEALRRAATDRVSRRMDLGAGMGMGQMFRALVNYDGFLRFRSGDHALEVTGHSPSLSGTWNLKHKSHLPGLTVSVFCQSPGRATGSDVTA